MRAAREGLPLVEREIQVLGLIANGGSYGEVAAELHLAHPSVKNYVHSAIKKLGARSQAHAVLLACRAGVLDGRPRQQRHGDHPGYTAHQKRGEEACDACRAGERAYQVERRQRRRQAAAGGAVTTLQPARGARDVRRAARAAEGRAGDPGEAAA